jgi:hypothetical protein
MVQLNIKGRGGALCGSCWRIRTAIRNAASTSHKAVSA